jgi:hypothetical protein
MQAANEGNPQAINLPAWAWHSLPFLSLAFIGHFPAVSPFSPSSPLSIFCLCSTNFRFMLTSLHPPGNMGRPPRNINILPRSISTPCQSNRL